MRYKITVVAGVAALAVAGATTAAASVRHDTATITPHACLVGKSRTMEHVYLDSADGPRCPKGSLGFTFPVGAPIPAPDPPATPALTQVTVTASIETTSTDDSLSVNCPASHPWAISGGGNDLGTAALTADTPVNVPGGDPDGWLASVPAGTSGTFLTVEAECVKT
jgi:hypothetical protein